MAVVGGILAGVGLRVFILTHALGGLDSDEAVVGLMANGILRGHLPTFFWGQAYGGTIEAFATSAVFWVFGPSVLGLKLVAVALDALAAGLIWRIGKRLFDTRVGIVAALAFWLWPATYVWWSTKARDFYATVLVLGLVMLLCALRVAERDDRWRDWMALGLAGGIGWWTSPLIVLLAVPALAWIALFNRRALRRIWIAGPPAIAGAAPWLAWNLGHHFASLKQQTAPEGYGAHLLRFVNEALPTSLGLRVPYTLRWMFPGAKAVYVALLVAGFVALRERPSRGALAVLIGVLVYPFLWAINPLVWVTAEGRYLFLLAPLIALTIGYGTVNRFVGAVVFAGLLALTIGGLTTTQHGLVGTDVDRPVPVHIGPLVHGLEAHRVQEVFASYWIAYRLDFEGHEQVAATVVAGANRSAALDRQVRSSVRPAYVFVTGSANEQVARVDLNRLGIATQGLQVDGFTIILPDRLVLPENLPGLRENP
jgi:hypothetical protein